MIKYTLSLFKYFIIFIFSLFITFQLGGFLYYLSYNYEKGDFFKYYELNYISNIYHKINILSGNCSYINDYLKFKIDAAPFSHNQNELKEIMMLTQKCNLLNKDHQFLTTVFNYKKDQTNKIKINFSTDDEQILISKYWFFIKDNKELLEKIKTNENKELIEMLKNKMK
jgi:hypothetical protein